MRVTMPTQEDVARAHAVGLTKYQYEEVVPVIEEIFNIATQYKQIVDQAYLLIAPHDQQRFDICYAPEPIQKRNQLLEDIHVNLPSFEPGGYREEYPLPTWRKQLGSWHNAIRKIEKAVSSL